MKLIKTVFKLSLLMVFLFAFNSAVFAADSAYENGKVIFEQKEITDKSILKERLEKGISDDPNSEKIHVKSFLMDPETKEKFNIPAKYTVQKIKQENFENGNEKTTYVLTASATLTPQITAPVDWIPGNRPVGDTKYGSITQWTTCVYESATINNILYVKVSSVKAYWNRTSSFYQPNNAICYERLSTTNNYEGTLGSPKYFNTPHSLGNISFPYNLGKDSATFTFTGLAQYGHVKTGNTEYIGGETHSDLYYSGTLKVSNWVTDCIWGNGWMTL